MEINNPTCPRCGAEYTLSLDEWGRTPWTLACNNCRITIGFQELQEFPIIYEAIKQFPSYLNKGAFKQ